MFSIVLSAVLIAAAAVGCASGISQQELVRQLESGTPPLLIDVRTGGEFREGHIPGAVNISIFSFRERFAELDPPRDRPIILICEHGPRAGFAGFMLRAAGYELVSTLEGAMKQWKKSGLPLEQ